MHHGDPNEIAVEERGREGEGEEEGVVEEEILKHMKERMVKEMIEVEEPHPVDMEDIEAEDLVVQMSVENLMDWTHLNLTPCSY